MFKISICFLLLSFTIYSQIYSQEDVEICRNTITMSMDKGLSDRPIRQVVAEIGKGFIGTDYQPYTLEVTDSEELVINLTGLDCTTYLENILVFSRMIKSGKTDFADYQKELTNIRYRDGVIEEYPSRLHYFSDWIYDNTSKGIVKDITEDLGGEKIRFKTGFMSSNPDKYKHLKSSPEFIKNIKAQESEINKRDYYYIPRKNVSSIENKITEGDLIAITTNIKGLDIGHVGIAVKQAGRIHLLHAPMAGSKVHISELPLHEYLAKIKNHSGIIVLQPLEPESGS
jgi:hypothetical protein